MDAYAQRHAEMLRGERPLRAIVYVCSGTLQCGGWGDRLKGIMFAFLFGILTNRSIFLHYDKGGGNLTDIYDTNRVNWLHTRAVTPDGARTHDPARGIDMVWCVNVNTYICSRDLLSRKKPIVRIHHNAFEAQILLGHPRLRGVAKRLGLSTRRDLLSVMYDFLFKPKPELQALIDKTEAKVRGAGDIMVGMHIRIGGEKLVSGKRTDRSNNKGTDRAKDDPKRVSFDQIPKFSKCATMLKKFFIEKQKMTYFIATDNEKAMRFLTVQPKFTAAHIGQLGHSEKSTYDIKNAMRMHLEFELLRRSDWLIMSPSGFGAFAALTGNVHMAIDYNKCRYAWRYYGEGQGVSTCC